MKLCISELSSMWMESFFDTVHFPQSAKQYPFKGRGVYLMKGRIVEEFGFPSIEVEKMAKLPFVKDRRYL